MDSRMAKTVKFENRSGSFIGTVHKHYSSAALPVFPCIGFTSSLFSTVSKENQS